MNWKNKEINLGDIKEGIVKKIIFESEEDLTGLINTLKSPCGCANPSFESPNKIVIKYNPGYIPVHLFGVGHSYISNSITVTYNNGDVDYLNFSGKIKKQ